MYYQRFLEVYYGEKDNIKEMQKCIISFRKELLRNPLMGKLNTHPEIRRFNRLAEQEWGFKSFMLYISPEIYTNACTLPLYYRPGTLFTKHNTMSNIIITDKGYKFKPEAGYCPMVTVSKGIFINKVFTDREIMAIILHEIGHNFQAAISDKQSSLATGAYIIVFILTIMNLGNIRNLESAFKRLIRDPLGVAGLYTKLTNMIDNYIYENFEGIYYFKDMMHSLVGLGKYPIQKVWKLICMIHNIPFLPLWLIRQLNPTAMLLRVVMGNYRGEKIADNFATIYGYGADIGKVQTSLMGDQLLKQIKLPIISPLLGFLEATEMLIFSIPDEHPQAITRIKDQSDYLKKELQNGDYDPKYKKEILDQIENIDAQVEQLNQFYYKGGMSDSTYFNKLYQCILYRAFGGDIKELGLINREDIHHDLETVKKRKMNETGNIFIDILNKTTFK